MLRCISLQRLKFERKDTLISYQKNSFLRKRLVMFTLMLGHAVCGLNAAVSEQALVTKDL